MFPDKIYKSIIDHNFNMLSEDCVFCVDIIKGKKAAIIFEDESTMAFMDYAPVEVGHVLVIPKNHYENLLDIDEENFLNVQMVSKIIAPALLEAVNADALNVGQNNGICANQVVMHYHLHLIPRFCDGYHGSVSPNGRFASRSLNWKRRVVDRKELESVASAIRIKLKGSFR